MKDTRTPTRYSTGVSRQNIEQALMNDQDALRARAGKLAAEPAAASDATSWFELLYQAAARARPPSPGPASHPTRTSCSGPGPARRAAPAVPPWSSAAG